MKPFLSYIGSKQQLLKHLEEYFPDSSEIKRYIEPFLGGGSVLLYMLENNVDVAHVNDLDKNLVSTWQVVKKHSTKLLTELKALNKRRSKASFYNLVDEYNSKKMGAIYRAALYIYFTKMSFNASMHWNNNKINPAWSQHHSHVNIYNHDLIEDISYLLQDTTTFHNNDYKVFLREMRIRKGDFIFLDPPYFVQDVQQYYKYCFDWKAFEELKDIADAIDKKGALFMITLNYHPELVKLFKGYTQKTIMKPSSLRLHYEKKRKDKELVIFNYTI